ncbi:MULTISPECIES: acid-activated periplasmic chaperone HdeA [Methylocystis]|uniref:acid-activated periplasmic chaperone HdeA n=1 Tax=Methylocystis TaxID=133 RepID=UPI001923AF20|nr:MULTISPECIES: acid-activated periplasmic chaperone HdeA [Methylocystis]MBL1255726.1 HdeA family protein [Methylocystis sp. Sn-Cys]
MKLRYFLLASCVLAAQAAVADTKKPVAKWTCEEFLAVQDDFQPKVVYWATAKAKSGKPDSVVDIEGTEKVVPMIIDDCKKAPSESFVTKLRNAWRAVEADAKKLKDKL